MAAEQNPHTLVSGLETVNLILAEAGRPDLQITDPAEMMPIEDPGDIFDPRFGNNFSWAFRIFPGKGEVTVDDIDGLRELPRLRDFSEYFKAEDSGDYPALANVGTHAIKPALPRMMTLSPKFMAELLLKVHKVDERQILEMEEVFFEAYTRMSNLVDRQDIDVIQDDGSVDTHHLTGKPI